MEENSPLSDFKPIKKYFSRIGLACSLLMLITVVLQYLGAFLVRLSAPRFTESVWFIWLLTVLPLYIFAFPVYLYVLPKPLNKPLADGRLGVKDFLMFLLMCFGIMYPLSLVGQGVMELLKGILHIGTRNPLEAVLSRSNVYVAFVFAVLLVPVMEELIFRKLLIDRIGRIDKRTALFFSALTFALFHGNFYQFFYAYGLGLLFAYVYIKTGRLRYTVGLHMCVNFFGAVLSPAVLKLMDTDALLKNPADQLSVLNDMLASLPSLLLASAFGLAVLAMTTAGIYFLIRERRRFRVAEPDDAIPDDKAFSIVYMTWGVAAFIMLSAVQFALNLVLTA